MRFATRVLLLQLTTVVAVVAICSATFAALAVQQLRAEAEASGLNIARTVAEDRDVRALVDEFSADPGTPEGADLQGGALQQLAADVTARTDALFVVITDDHGIRLAHPDPARLGEVVSTSYAEALAGQEVVTWETGTLGESARAKVPVYPLGGGDPVGEISVGFERASVFDELPAAIGAIVVVALGAVAIAVLASMLMRRRWERLTLGLQPEELVALVQNQAAVLDGVGDGVVALDTDRIVRVCNSTAERMLGLRAPLGLPLDRLDLPESLISALAAERTIDGVVLGERVLYLDVHPVQHDGRALGHVVIVRDRTDLIALSERLETVRAMTGALRVQRHEFANRLHVAAGLIDAQRVPDARAFLAELLARGPVDFDIDDLDRVGDPLLQSLLGAQAIEARERGVELRIAGDTALHGALLDVEDAAAVMGNLVGNAITAAVRGDAPRWVEVALLDDGDTLVLTISDSGAGVDSDRELFTRSGETSADADTVHGHGFGLPLSRELARRRGGEVWLIDAGGVDSGAVFGARLPGVMGAPSKGSDR